MLTFIVLAGSGILVGYSVWEWMMNYIHRNEG
jgi:hypothetical protein